MAASSRYLAAAHSEQREDEQVERVHQQTGEHAGGHRLAAQRSKPGHRLWAASPKSSSHCYDVNTRPLEEEDGEIRPPGSRVHHDAVPQSVGQHQELQQERAAGGSLQAGEGAAGGSLEQREPQVTLTQRPLQLVAEETARQQKGGLLWRNKGSGGVRQPAAATSRGRRGAGPYPMPQPRSPPGRQFSRCQQTATPPPGSSSCFLSAGL